MSNSKSLFKKLLAGVLFFYTISFCFGCAIGKKEVLATYDDQKCEYIATSVTKNYRYRDYIVDDITDGSYKLSSPSITDYKIQGTVMDYDLAAYTSAKFDYELKVKAIESRENDLVDICRVVRENSFVDKSSMIYFHDLENDKTILLSQTPVTNLHVDPDIPYVYFNANPSKKSENDNVDMRKRKIKLSDLISVGSSPEEYIKVMLFKNKEIKGYYRDQRINDESKLKRGENSRALSLD